MTSPVLAAGIAGIGFWARGLPSWAAACAYLAGGAVSVDAPTKPSPQLLEKHQCALRRAEKQQRVDFGEVDPLVEQVHRK